MIKIKLCKVAFFNFPHINSKPVKLPTQLIPIVKNANLYSSGIKSKFTFHVELDSDLPLTNLIGNHDLFIPSQSFWRRFEDAAFDFVFQLVLVAASIGSFLVTWSDKFHAVLSGENIDDIAILQPGCLQHVGAIQELMNLWVFVVLIDLEDVLVFFELVH